MPRNSNIFFERAEWKRPLEWSAIFHGAIFAAIFLYAYLAGSRQGATWGEGEFGSAIGARLVSSAVPLPANPVHTENIVANQSQGLSRSEQKALEQIPEALPIPAPQTKPKKINAREKKPPPPPPQDNTVPYGEGGPVAGPYTVFNAQNIQGGLSFGESGEFGKLYGWYVDVVRRKVSENWLKYEVDPSITAARRVYLTFDILRDGSPTNVQVEESSGVPSLDQSAVRALERIDSFGPLPAGYSGDKVSVEFWFDYKR
jgi:protein TonB